MIRQYYPKSVSNVVEFDAIKSAIEMTFEKSFLEQVVLFGRNVMCKTMTEDAISAISSIVFEDSSITTFEGLSEKLNTAPRITESTLFDKLNSVMPEGYAAVNVFPETIAHEMYYGAAMAVFDELVPSKKNNITLEYISRLGYQTPTTKSSGMWALDANHANTYAVMVNKGVHSYDGGDYQPVPADDLVITHHEKVRFGNGAMFSGHRSAGLIDIVGYMYDWDVLNTLANVGSMLPINMRMMYFGWNRGILGRWGTENRGIETSNEVHAVESFNRNPVCHSATAALILLAEVG